MILHFLGGPTQGHRRKIAVASSDQAPDRYSVLLNRGTADRPDVVRVDHQLVATYQYDDEPPVAMYWPDKIQSTALTQTTPPPLWLYE